MWRLYCGDREGVALKTTFVGLESSMASTDLVLGCVQYRDYINGNAFNDSLDPLMFKRDGFSSEQEVRLLSVNLPHYHKLQQEEAGVIDLRERIDVPWSMEDAVELILVSPYASDMYFAAVQAAVSALNPKLAPRVARSGLWGEPAF